ncbi:MAG: tetratricopeptide repeat protein [Candidatus Cyclobacteriaceae bacterium M2_1C_046]
MRLFFFIIAFFSFNISYSQQLMDKVADEACKCIRNERASNQTVSPNDIFKTCLEENLAMNEAKLRKAYGDAFFDDPESKIAYNFGIELGKKLTKECDSFIDMIVDHEKNKNNNAADYFTAAEKLSGEGQYKEAIENYSKAIQISPKNFEYHNSRGVVYYKSQDYYRAIGDFYTATELSPENYMPWYNIAYAMYQMGDANNANKHVTQALALSDEYCDSHNLKGLILSELQQQDSAVISFKEAAECDPDNATFLYNVGYTLYEQEEYTEALEWFEKSYAIDPENLDLISYIGNSHSSLENSQKAIDFHTLHIQKGSGENYIPYYNRGFSLFKIEKYEEALEDFKKAYQIDSTDLDVILYMGKIYDQLDSNDLAEKYYNKLVLNESNDAFNYDTRAAFYEKVEKYDMALKDYMVSLSLYPDDCTIHQKMAEIYLKQGQQGKANESNRMALEMGCGEN